MKVAKGNNSKPGVPESFRVTRKILSQCDMRVLDEDDQK